MNNLLRSINYISRCRLSTYSMPTITEVRATMQRHVEAQVKDYREFDPNVSHPPSG